MKTIVFRYLEGDKLYSWICETETYAPVVGDYLSYISFDNVCDITKKTDDPWESISVDDQTRLYAKHFRVKARQWNDYDLLVVLELSDPLKYNEY